MERDELLREAQNTEHGVDAFRAQYARTLDELNATKLELAKHQGRLEIITDRMFDPPISPIQHAFPSPASHDKPEQR